MSSGRLYSFDDQQTLPWYNRLTGILCTYEHNRYADSNDDDISSSSGSSSSSGQQW